MSSKKVETIKPVKIEPVAIEPVAEAVEELLTDEEIDSVVGESAIALVQPQGLESIESLDFDQEETGDFIENIGLTRSQLVEMNAAAETTVRLEEALKDHHREELQREKANAARKKLAALKSRPNAIAQLVKQITATN